VIVKLYKEEGGTTTVFVKKTRPWENPSRAVVRVGPERVKDVLAQLVGEMGERPPRRGSGEA
jgi:hypothetical protein